MREPGGPVLRYAVPFRAAIQRFAFVLLIAAAFLLMLLGRFDNALVARTRLAVVDAVAPIMDVVSRPVAAANRVADAASDLIRLRSELAGAREENRRLLQWQSVARRLEAENAAYRALLDVKTDAAPFFVSARVIADSGAPFVRTVLMNAGYRDGVRKGQAVMNEDGLLGRVLEVGQRSARVLLLSDLNSRVPIINGASQQRGVLVGDNSDLPKLVFLPNQARVAPGDPIVTSGHGGLFPPGLPIGAVGSVADGVARVKPLVDWHRIEFVRVVRYRLPRLAPAGEDRPVAE